MEEIKESVEKMLDVIDTNRITLEGYQEQTEGCYFVEYDHMYKPAENIAVNCVQEIDKFDTFLHKFLISKGIDEEFYSLLNEDSTKELTEITSDIEEEFRKMESVHIANVHEDILCISEDILNRIEDNVEKIESTLNWQEINKL